MMVRNNKRRQGCGQWCLGIVGHSLHSHALAIMAATQAMVRDNYGIGRHCLDIVGHSLLARAKASMVAARITVHNNNGGQAEDGALAALLPIPCPLF
jgi:hypothetical protein